MSIRKGTSVIAGGIYIDNTPISGSANAVSSGGVYTALLNKADTDLSNINASSTAKDTINHWAFPDYTAGTNKSFGTDYTADSDGWIFFGGSSTSGQINCTLNIDNVMVAQFWKSSSNTGSAFIIPVAKGSSWKANYAAGSSGGYLAFYPCRK